jgi:cytokinesis protein
VNLQELRKGLGDLRDGLKQIRDELAEYFADINQNDAYGKKMWAFIKKANILVDDLVDDVNLADTTFTEVIKYYGEEDKNMSSTEFFGIFKTFVTSYKVCICLHLCTFLTPSPQKCKVDNQAMADERLATEKRKQAAEELRAHREKAMEAANENADVLDSLLEKLRNGDTVVRKTRRRGGAGAGAGSESRPAVPTSLQLDSTASGDTADIARDMLAQLQSNGFVAAQPSPTFPPPSTTQRRRRKRLEVTSEDFPEQEDVGGLQSPSTEELGSEGGVSDDIPS